MNAYDYALKLLRQGHLPILLPASLDGQPVIAIHGVKIKDLEGYLKHDSSTIRLMGIVGVIIAVHSRLPSQGLEPV